MAITTKLYETALGADESPWATDTDGNTITREVTAGTLTIQVVDSEDDITAVIGTTSNRFRAYASSPATFADGAVRGVLRSTLGGSANNQGPALVLRTGLICSIGGDGSSQLIDVRNYTGSFIGSQSMTFAADTWYEVVFHASGGTVHVGYYTLGAFPNGADYKTISWDYTNTSASYTTASGNAGIGGNRFTAGAVTHRFKNLLAFASASGVVLPTVALTSGNTLLTIATTDAAAKEKRAALWYFLRYKAGASPDATGDDGTLITGAGTGLGGDAVRTSGRFIDAPASFNVTGLINGTTYYVRPYAMMIDGTIVAGVAVPVVPSGGDVTPPGVPSDFVAVYADPFVDGRIDMTWTNPSEAGDYRITARTDGTYPTNSTDGTVILTWTAYTANTQGRYNATGLTDGSRYKFALWHRDATPNVNAGAFAELISADRVALDTPADAAAAVQISPYLVWNTSTGEAEDALPIHYQVEVSVSDDRAAFATDTAVLSSFAGGDEDPLSEGGAWSGPMQNAEYQCELNTNQAAHSNNPNATKSAQSYWNAATYDKTEVYATIATLPTGAHGVAVWAKLQNPGNATTATAYAAAYHNGIGWRLFKLTGGTTFTQLGATEPTAASANDGIGLEVIDGAIKLLHYDGADWLERIAYTDASPITGAGYIGMQFDASTTEARLDAFGGGEILTTEADFVAGRVIAQSSLVNGPTGFEYESVPGTWAPLPVTGLDVANVGSDVRFYAGSLTVAGHYYWRVTAQQPSA